MKCRKGLICALIAWAQPKLAKARPTAKGSYDMRTNHLFAIILAMLFAAFGLSGGVFARNLATTNHARNYLNRLPQDEITYFLLPDRFENGDPTNDRGSLDGGPEITGFDISHKGFYQGGDIRGIINRLDYIQDLGATAIWLAPIFKNKPVQGEGVNQSSGYHGYWITDFTTIDPHFGTEADFKELVQKAHARGLKIYMDIITNHTADVIYYNECIAKECPYRSLADFPQFGYRPVVPPSERSIKVPSWLNDPTLYHNRGNSNWHGESSVNGDFAGLDDIATELPRVRAGFIEIYGAWIDKYKIDGFRIDTVKHVDAGFWQEFIPAMERKARAAGIPNFHIFAESYIDGVNPGSLAAFSWHSKMPSVLDFSFQSAVRNVIGKNQSIENFETLYNGDILYKGGANTAMKLQTFVSNHDMGRLAMQLRADIPNIKNDELLARVKLANAIMLLTRGAPTIYSGDEQGFIGDGHDQDARQPLFATNVANYNDNDVIGESSPNNHFNKNHSLYAQIAELARIRAQHPALRRGTQKMRAMAFNNQILSFSRFDPVSNKEYIIAFNVSGGAVSQNIEIAQANRGFLSLIGSCPSQSSGIKSINIALPPFGYVVCKSL